MKTLLRIDASMRVAGSHSRGLADYFEGLWTHSHPGGRVLRRDLAVEPPPHLHQAAVDAFMDPQSMTLSGKTALEYSDLLVSELESADEVLLSSPVYNFNTPSTLKAWADHVVRFGRTFTVSESGYRGLLGGKTAYLVTARGGLDPGQLDSQAPFLNTLFRFLGFSRVEFVTLEGTRRGDAQLQRARVEAMTEMESWLASDTVPTPNEGALACQHSA